MEVHLALNMILISIILISLVLSVGAFSVHQRYFIASLLMVTSSEWSAQPSTVQLFDASALNICQTFAPMSSMTLSIHFKRKIANWNSIAQKAAKIETWHSLISCDDDYFQADGK
jgi:hypothetical protein